MKITVTTTYKDSKGNLRTRITHRHPKLSDLTFESLPAKSFALTKEQKRKDSIMLSIVINMIS